MLKLLDEVRVVSSNGCDDGYIHEYGIIVAIDEYDEVEYTIVGFNKQRYAVCDYDNSFWACAGWKKENLRYIGSNTSRDILEKSKRYTLYSKALHWLTANYSHTWKKLNEIKLDEENNEKEEDDMYMIDLNNVESVEFVLENCEYITIPKGCFKSLELIEYENEEYELNCKIYGVDSIVYSSLGQLSSKQNPLERLNDYNDIVRLVITYMDDSTKTFDLVWLDWHGDDNDFQTTNMISYKELDISVKVYSRNKFIRSKCDNDIISIFNNIGDNVLYMCEEGHYDNEECCYNEICNNLRKNNKNTICDTLNMMLG